MQKIIVVFLVSMLIAPAGVFAQGLPLNDCRNCGMGQVPSNSPEGNVLQKAVRSETARLAGNLQTPVRLEPSPQRPGSGAHGGLIAAAKHKALAKKPMSNKMKAGIMLGVIGAVVGSFLICYGAGGCGGVS